MASDKDLEFVDAVRAVVADAGEDFIYTDDLKDEDGECCYVKDGEPSCLIGRALFLTGTPIEQLVDLEGLNADGAMSRDVYGSGLIKAAQSAQEVQDEGQPWGVALSRFLAMARREGIL